MALSTPTQLDAKSDSATASTIVSNSVSPSSNTLLLVAGATRDASVASASISTTLSNVGTWTVLTRDGPGASYGSLVLGYAVVTGAPGSGTVTVNFGVSCTRHSIVVAEIASGYSTSSPVVQNKNGTSSASTLSLTLDSTPISNSTVFAAVASRGATAITPGSNFTELSEIGTGSGNPAIEVEYDANSATTTVDWSTLGTAGNAGIGIEIRDGSAVVNTNGFFQILY